MAVRLAVLMAALVGLLALVALASSAGIPWSGTRGDAETDSLRTLGRLIADVVLLGTAGVLVVLYVRRLRRPSLSRVVIVDETEVAAPRRRWLRALLKIAPYAIIGLIGLVVYLAAREVDHRFPRPAPESRGEAPGGPAAAPGLRPPGSPEGWLLVVAGGLALATLATAAATPVVRRRLTGDGTVDHTRTALARVVDESIDDLRAEPDPRRAGVAASARMEAGFDARGHGRLAHEAPLEYLGRVLAEAKAPPGPVSRLTALFESAKFSRRDIGPPAKEEAIACLVEIRDDLTA